MSHTELLVVQGTAKVWGSALCHGNTQCAGLLEIGNGLAAGTGDRRLSSEI